jgi:hypothetical protein
MGYIACGRSSDERRDNKMCDMRKHLGGWARHTVGILQKEKENFVHY